MIVVVLTTVTFVAASVPKVTVVVPVVMKIPVRVTKVADEPKVGLIALTDGSTDVL